MMKYPYDKGESAVNMILAILDGIGIFFLCSELAFLLKDSDFMTSNVDPFFAIFFVFGLFVFLLINIVCIGVNLLIKNNRNKRIQSIMNSGYKTNGKVLSIEHYYKRVGGRRIESFWMIVQFMDRDGNYIIYQIDVDLENRGSNFTYNMLCKAKKLWSNLKLGG